MTNELHVAVPTTTIIAVRKEDPFMVATFRSVIKHGNKLILPGGRVKVGAHDWLQTGLIEVEEELGIKNLEDPKFFCLCSNPNRDIKKMTIQKFLDGKEIPVDFSYDIQVIGHFTFDVVITGKTDAELDPDGEEAAAASYVDVRTIAVEDFALDHGKILLAYRNYLETGELPAMNQF